MHYKKNKFFTTKEKVISLCIDGFTVKHKKVFTPVISSEVVGKEVKNLSKPVILKFNRDQSVSNY